MKKQKTKKKKQKKEDIKETHPKTFLLLKDLEELLKDKEHYQW